MSASSTLARTRVQAILTRNADGSQQFGLRDQFRKLTEQIGLTAARSWLVRHIELTQEFRELLADRTVLFGDTEDTGFGEADELCELSLVYPDKSVAFDSLIKPSVPINAGATGVHGITNAMVEYAPTFGECADQIEQALADVRIVFWYNSEFDTRMIEQTEYAAERSITWPRFVDIMGSFAVWVGDWNTKQNGYRWPKLEGGHRALGDCLEMIELVELMSTSDLEYAGSLLS